MSRKKVQISTMTVRKDSVVNEENAIEELRSRLADEMPLEMYEDTHMFRRFLKARDYNLNNAEYMLRNHITWRKKNSFEKIRAYKAKEVLNKYYSGGCLGLDKEGCPIRYYHFGNLDPKGIRKSVKFSECEMHLLQFMEQDYALLDQQSTKLGRPLPGCLTIIDMENFSFSAATDKKMLGQAVYLTKVYQDNYPERLKMVIVINASPYFTITYNFIKVFLAASIINKAKFFGSDGYQEFLREHIDPDVLPAFLGGNRTDPDGNPLCLTVAGRCGKIPAKYFSRFNNRRLSIYNGAIRLVVPRMSQSKIELEVGEIGSVIEWEFEIKSRNIDFGLFRNETDRNGKVRMVEVVAPMRLDTEDFAETGMHKCEKTGTYVIVFDNTYSWFRGKELYYIATVKSPAELEKSLEEHYI